MPPCNGIGPARGRPGAVDGRDVAAIQNDARLTAAERVDLVANQVLPKVADNEDPSESDDKP